MKKWFITFCALFLITTQIPAANAASVNEGGKSLPVLQFVNIIKWENHNGFFIRTIEKLSLHNDEGFINFSEKLSKTTSALEELILAKQNKEERTNPSDESTEVETPDITTPTENPVEDENNQSTNNDVVEEDVNEEENVEVTPTNPSNNYAVNYDKLNEWFNQYYNQNDDYKNQQPTYEQPTYEQPTYEQPTYGNDATVEAEKPAPTPSNNEEATVSDFEQQVVDLTNAERAKYGLAPLKIYAPLMNVAEAKSQDMATNNYFSHNSPTYGSPFDQIKAAGISYRSAGENIAQGQRTPEQVVQAWMNSEGHRANILNSSYTHIGVGFVEDGYYWTQQFIQL